MNISNELFVPLESSKDEAFLLELEKTPWESFKENKLALAGLCCLVFLVLGAFLGPLLSEHSYEETHLQLKNQSPSWQFWFGTDDLGRDLFTRIWYGARISLFVGFTAACIDCLVGILWGSLAALGSSKMDEALMRTADLLYALPYLLLVILLNVALGSGLFSIILALTLTGWVTMARVVRGQLLLLKEMDYITAARAIGVSFFPLLTRHLLPNAFGPILVTVTFTIPSAIFTEAFLSFIGLGIQAPMASWGAMVNDGLPALVYYPWRLFFPAFFISLTLLSLHLVGEGLKNLFSPSEIGGHL